MTIAFGAIGAKSAGGTTTVSVAHPSSVGAGDLLIAGRVSWNAMTHTAESGWDLRSNLSGGTGTAADAHTTRSSISTRVAAGGETGSVTFDQAGTASGALGVMARYTKASGKDWSIAEASGTDDTHGANRSVTTGTVALAAGDVLVAVMAVDTDTSLTITSPTFSASGITFGTVTRRTSGAGVTTGTDGNIEVFDVDVSSGTGTVAVTFAITTATSTCGPVSIVRLREVDPPPPLTPPTRIGGFIEATTGNYSANTTPKTAASVDVLTDDLIVLTASAEHSGLNEITPTHTGTASITWTRLTETTSTAADFSYACAWQGVVTSGGTMVISCARTGDSILWGFSAALYRDHGGVGSVVQTNGLGTAQTAVSCSNNSALIGQINDWNAVDGASRTWVSVNGSALAESLYYRNAANHTVYGARSPDTGSSGSHTWGLSAPTGLKAALVAVEVRGVESDGGAASGTGALALSGTAGAAATATATGALALSGTAVARGAAGATGALALSGTATAGHATGAAGALDLSGTAGARGSATATGALVLSGAAGAASTTTASGALALTGQAGATAATGATGTLSLSGAADATGDTPEAASGTGALSLSGTAGAQGATGATGALTLSGTAGAEGPVVASGVLSLSGTAGVAATPSATGALSLTGAASSAAPAAATGSLALTGSSSSTGSTGSTGTLSLSGTSGARAVAVVTGVLDLTGGSVGGSTATAAGTLLLSGLASLDGEWPATASGALSLSGSAGGVAPGTASGTVSLSGSAGARSPLAASGSLSLNGEAGPTGRASAAGNITLSGTAVAVSDGTVSGSGVLTLTGTAGGTTTVLTVGHLELSALVQLAQAPDLVDPRGYLRINSARATIRLNGTTTIRPNDTGILWDASARAEIRT